MSDAWTPAPPVADAGEGSRQVGRYRLLRRLGSGGMGEVYLARDLRLDREVAIKHPHAAVSAEQRARFRREAWAAARLAHPAIIPIFDVISDQQGDWIVMEYVDGPTLRDYLESAGRPALAVAIAWAAQLADGLAAAHDKGIVHRDVKAENVMMAPSGHLKIVDFGLAKSFFAEGGGEAALSASGAVLGTLRTMAPEQARGQRVDLRADLFSFGVLLYELLAGTSPFAGSSPVEIITRLAVSPHEKVSVHAPEAPPALDDLIDELLAKAPEARPASARPVAERLRSVLAQLGSQAQLAAAAAFEIAAAAKRPGSTDLPEDLDSTWLEGGGLPREFVPPEPAAAGDSGAESSSLAVPKGPAAAARKTHRVLLAALLVCGLGLAFAGYRGGFWEGGGSPTEADPLQLYQAGMAELEHWYRPGKVDSAIGYLQRALLAEPHAAPALAGLSRAYWYRSKLAGRDPQSLQQAKAVAEQAVAADAHLAAAQLALAFAALELGDPGGAEAALARAELFEPSALAAYGRGLLASARGDLAAAEKAYRQALERRESAEVHNALGYLQLRQHRLAEAEAAFRRAIELAPDAVFGHRNLASVHFARGDGAAAAAELQRAIEIDPQASLYSNLGTIFFYQGLYAEAQIAYRHAIDKAGEEGVSTNAAQLWANLGDSYRFLPDRQEDARLAFRRAVQLIRAESAAKPGDLELRSRLGLYLAKAGDAEAARSELQKSLDPAGAGAEKAARVRALLAYEALGDRRASLDVLEKALGAGLALAEIEREPELAALRADPAYHRLAAASEGAPAPWPPPVDTRRPAR